MEEVSDSELILIDIEPKIRPKRKCANKKKMKDYTYGGTSPQKVEDSEKGKLPGKAKAT